MAPATPISTGTGTIRWVAALAGGLQQRVFSLIYLPKMLIGLCELRIKERLYRP